MFFLSLVYCAGHKQYQHGVEAILEQKVNHRVNGIQPTRAQARPQCHPRGPDKSNDIIVCIIIIQASNPFVILWHLLLFLLLYERLWSNS